MDINFFDEFKDNKTNKLKLLSSLILILIFLSISLIAIRNQIKIIEIGKGIDKRLNIIESPNSTSKLLELENIRIELEEKQMEMERLNKFESSISQFNHLDEDLLEEIYFNIKAGIILSTMNYEESIIELSGFGANPNVIAEYSERLGKSYNISEVRILNITLYEGYYNFLINLKLEGDENEILN